MPVRPITRTAQWRYDIDKQSIVRIVSPTGDDYCTVLGKTREIRIDRASVLVKKLNEGTLK